MSLIQSALSSYAVDSYHDEMGSWKVQGIVLPGMKEYEIRERKLIEATVSQVFFYNEGEKDGNSWIIVGKMINGDYFSFEASCDFTGFSCQGGGELVFAPSSESLRAHGLPIEVPENISLD
jgi:hypothetical protein